MAAGDLVKRAQSRLPISSEVDISTLDVSKFKDFRHGDPPLRELETATKREMEYVCELLKLDIRYISGQEIVDLGLAPPGVPRPSRVWVVDGCAMNKQMATAYVRGRLDERFRK